MQVLRRIHQNRLFKGGLAVPYIKQSGRKDLDPILDPLIAKVNDLSGPDSAGALAYVIFKLLRVLTAKHSFSGKAMLYGSAVASLDEYYRRDLSVYENDKMVQNGDCP